MNIQKGKLLFTGILLVLSAIASNLFVIAQAGLAPLSSLAIQFLLPSVLLILLTIIFSKVIQYDDIFHLAINGIFAGLIATVSLEIFRESGFRLGTMPGELPRLMGVLLLNRFAEGPDIWSDIAGWAYHFWNGASFGIIFSLIFGKSKEWYGLLCGVLIGIGFMVSPVVKSLGIGLFGHEYKRGFEFATTVTLAHMAYGVVLAFILKKMNRGRPNIWQRFVMNSQVKI